MLINNVYIIGSGKGPSKIEIKGSKITSVTSANGITTSPQSEISYNFSNAIAFPGLINSHDHLEFNLFSKLGNKIYNDYVEWGNDIHENNKEQIEKIKRIPYELRFKWGLYKNLICGVTTVAHHGNGKIFNFKNLPEVVSHYNYLHSIRLEKKWRLKLNLLFNGKPFVIHIGEGTNHESFEEINDLLKWNIFTKKIIGVHGTAADKKQIGRVEALVWCPDSNIFLYYKTADIPSLKKHTIILFGTDSTLSADWNLWNHLRFARKMDYLDDKELYNAITVNASTAWGMNSIGSIEQNKAADIVVCKNKFKNEWDSFYNTNPEDILLIVKNGEVVFIDSELVENQNAVNRNEYDLISVNSVQKYIIKGITELMQAIKRYVPDYNFHISSH